MKENNQFLSYTKSIDRFYLDEDECAEIKHVLEDKCYNITLLSLKLFDKHNCKDRYHKYKLSRILNQEVSITSDEYNMLYDVVDSVTLTLDEYNKLKGK